MGPSSSKTTLTNILIAVVTAVASVAAVIITAQITGPLPISLTQTISEKQTTFDVSGESEITTAPDEAQITLGVNFTGPSAVSVQEQANETINTITSELKTLGIKDEDIQTQNYSIYPQYDFESSSRAITGYQINANLLVKIRDFENLNGAIDTATTYGANQVGGVNFALSEDKQNELTKQARMEAIEDAKNNAQELSKLAGMRLGKIVNIFESKGSAPQPFPMERVMTFDAMGGETAPSTPTQIEPGSTTFNYYVTLSYETL